MRYKIYIILLGFVVFGCQSEHENIQNEGIIFSIDKIEPSASNETLDIYLSAYASNREALLINDIDNFTVKQSIKNKSTLDFLKIKELDSLDVTQGSNFRIVVNPKLGEAIYGLEEREFRVSYKEKGVATYSQNVTTVLGSSGNFIDIRPFKEMGESMVLSIGAGLVLGLLLLFVIGIPLYNKYYFKKNYIRKYGKVKKTGVVSRDPLELRTIEDDELVVAMHGRFMLLDTWKSLRDQGIGLQAKDHSDFFKFPIDGNFFSQSGLFKRINWLWFGLAGGFLTYCLNVVFSYLDLTSLHAFLSDWLDTPNKKIATALTGHLTLGLAAGICIPGALALVEEIGQSRKFSVMRIFKRIAVGTLMALFIFTIEGVITTKFLNNNYFGNLISWTLFGTFLGWVLTLFSSITWKNGIIGGFISGVTASQIYAILHLPVIMDYLNADFAEMISFLLYGGLLGYVLFTVVSRLEDFELVYLSPTAFSGQVKAISKWLKSPAINHIYIGTDPACEVYIKWNDKFVATRHARLTYVEELVFIEPIDDNELLINDQPITEQVELRHQDKIQLGRQSVSLMQFIAKYKNENHTKQKVTEKKEAPTVKPAVTITRKNLT